MEEMRIEIGEDGDSDDDDELMDDDDRQLIDKALEQTNTPTTESETCTNPRRDLTDSLQSYDPHFLESVLPLP